MKCKKQQLRRDDKGRLYSHLCGQCLPCLIRKRQEWAARIELEAMGFPGKTGMISLTYSDDCVPLIDSGLTTLEAGYGAAFMKRLRKNTGLSLRHFFAGEYGDVTGRAHYHAVIFGIDVLAHRCEWIPPPEERKRLAELRSHWPSYGGLAMEAFRAHQLRGNVDAGDLRGGGAQYCASYVVKKLVTSEPLAPGQVSEKEARSISRMPALGTVGAVAIANGLKQRKLYPADRPDLCPGLGWHPVNAWVFTRHRVDGNGRSSKTHYPLPMIMRDKICAAYAEDTRDPDEVSQAREQRLLFPDASRVVLETTGHFRLPNRHSWVAKQKQGRKL